MVEQITITDTIVSFFFIVLSILLIQFLKPKSRANHNKFLKAFFYSKIAFALIFVLIHVYYYVGGDTFLYFSGAKFFAEQIFENPFKSLELYLSSRENVSNFGYNANYLYALQSSNDVFFMSKIIGIFSFLTGNNYMACSIVYTLITSIGLWKLYLVLCELYPNMYKYFAYGILFYPSLGIWGSGILKDPLTLCCVGLIFWSTFNIIKARKYFISIVLIIINSYLCFLLKPYILYTFVPIMLIWAQTHISGSLKNPIIKAVVTPLIIVIFALGGYFAINSISSGAGKYSLESVQSVAEGFQSWHTYLAETRDQSGYSLGEINFTPLGILQKAPEGFWVTYYRPFIIGDVRNLATLFEAIQTFILLLISLIIIFRVGVFNLLKIILLNKDVRAFMLFAVIFGIAVGITSYNFGALSRYKIPSLPFYMASLAIIYYLGYIKPKGLYK